MTSRPDPVLLALVADHAQAAAEALARAIAAARTAGVTVDAEVDEAAATLRSWAAWLDARATQANGGDAAAP